MPSVRGCASSSWGPAGSEPRSPRSRAVGPSSTASCSPTSIRPGPNATVVRLGDTGFTATTVDAERRGRRRALARAHRSDVIVNACDPRFNPAIFRAAFDARLHVPRHGDDLSHPHPKEPYARVGVLLGDEQLAASAEWEQAGLLALVGIGVEPGLSDVFARYAADHLFAEIDEIGVRDGSNLTIDGYDFAPTFSIWTTIEECLNPPVDLGEGPGLVHDRAVLGARDVRVPRRHRRGRVRERRARRSRAHPAVDRLQASHVQVRARRSVHRGAAHAASARPRQQGTSAGARRRRRAA